MVEFLKRMLGLAMPYKLRFGLGIAFGVLAGVLEPLMVLTVVTVYSLIFQDKTALTQRGIGSKAPGFVKDFLDRMISSTSADHPVSPWVWILLIGAIPAVFLLRSAVTYLNAYLLQWVSLRAISDLRIRLFAHLVNLPASFFNNARSADLMSRVLNNTEVIRGMISNSLISMVKDPITVITTLTVMMAKQPMLTTMAFIILPICIVPIAIYGRKGRKATSNTQLMNSNLGNTMIETFSGIRIIKAYNMEENATEEFRKISRHYVSQAMRMVRAMEAPGPLLEFAGSIGVAALLAYAVLRPSDRPEGGDFLLLVLGVITMYRPIKQIVRLHATLEQARAAADGVYELLATKSDLPEPVNPKSLKAVRADIHFDDVSFAYGEKAVLQKVQLTVKGGQLVALVGHSGSGKTTLTNLLLRFYDVTSGSIRIGGVDIRDVTTKTLRENMAVVTQEATLFNESIRANIAVGRPGASDAEIIAAAKHAHAHDFIIEKPEGYDTIIGERGTALSGGQRQRIAIARALLRNAPILILDEATNALDTEMERIVQLALEELMVGRTTICIAHRLSTIQKADVIVAMQEGRIMEMGSHAELLAKEGVYHKLYQLAINA